LTKLLHECLVADVVSVRRGAVAILDRVSLVVRPGEMVAIIGSNGAGKSTLLRVLAGELVPSSGRVSMLGRPISNISRVELARRRASVQAAQTIEFPFLVEELVRLGRHPHPRDPEADRRHIQRAMVFTDVDHLAARNHSSLSTGERQRVELARALAQLGDPEVDRPTWLLLDEPTANLDLAHGLILLERLRGLCRAGVGIAMVVHDLGLALRFADRLLLLAEGRVLADAEPHVLARRPELLHDGFGLEAEVVEHPRGGWPVVLPTSARARPRTQEPKR
jgi:iron complex transport system ATP-binding protein